MKVEHGDRISLTGATVAELARVLGSPARARAAVRWVYGGPATPASLPDDLPGVSAKVWSQVRDRCELTLPRVVSRHPSEDGAVKYALDVAGATVEAVLIPGRARSTVCVSSQSGCTRKCAFCATARLGFTRNLTAPEMVGQFLLARTEAPADAPLRNVVFMGMGEPMDNLDEVLRAVEVLTQAPAPQLAASRVTVSTSGVLPGIRRFLEECRASLALSLNGTTDAARERLMPQNKIWPIGELLEALRADAARRPGRLTFVEYVLFDGVNDSDEDAARLVELLRGVPARVNLIPHNTFPGSELRPSPQQRVKAFQTRILKSGIRCLVRVSRGEEVGAACGQLALRGAGA